MLVDEHRPAFDDLQLGPARGPVDHHPVARIGPDHATLLLLPTDPVTAADPWFVRAAGYPGVGAALAWDTLAMVEPEAPLHRGYRLVIADGAQEPEHLAAIAHDLA